MRRVAYLAMAAPDDVAIDGESGFAAMRERGLEPVVQPWREPGVNWDGFAAAYLSTPWDYPQHLAEFRALIDAIDASTAKLVNPAGLVRWNLEKTYLRELESNGIRIVPTLWFEHFDSGEIPAWFEALGSDRLVIKPVVGANASQTFLVGRFVNPALVHELEAAFAATPFCVQPFIDRIRTDGEYSLFFFGGEYSHAVRKLPATGDFRTQEHFGADVVPFSATNDMIGTGMGILAQLEPSPVYARIDFVRDARKNCLLMELELIEPSLYLRTDPDAADRFATAFANYLEV